MNRAAAELNTVQSNVTAHIKALEADLGCMLFERHARGVSLTAAGQRLLPYADRAARLLADARNAVRDDGVPRGLLTIGSLETTAALHLTPLLAGYAAEYPEVDLVLRAGTTRELIGEVLEGRVDGAYVCGPVGHTELVGEVRIVGLRAGCSYRQMLEALLARRGITVTRRLEFGTLEAIFGCVAANLGITLLPRALIGPVWSAGRVSLHPLPPADARVDTVFIRRRDAPSSSALKAFLVCAAGRFKTAEAA